MRKFIALAGIDASGKATQSKKLYDYFVAKGVESVLFSLPEYKSTTGEIILGFLKGQWSASLSHDCKFMYEKEQAYHTNVSAHLFQCCQVANRMEALPDGLWDKNTNTAYVADRYNESALAYGLAAGLDLDWLIKMHRNFPQPDVNIFLDIPVDESVRRRPERRDQYESNLDFLNKVRDSYLHIFKQMGPSYVIIDATGSKDETFQRILECV